MRSKQTQLSKSIVIKGACEHNLKDLNLSIQRGKITAISGVSGSGKSSLAFDTILTEAQRRFFDTLSHYSRQYLDIGSRPNVGSITGLSPAISLAQNETQPSKRSTVATLTDLGELLGLLFSKFGERYCPKHDLLTDKQDVHTISDSILHNMNGKRIGFCVTVAEQKRGSFGRQIESFSEKGYSKALIDGELVSIDPTPELSPSKKHTIRIILDQFICDRTRKSRLEKAISTGLDLGDGTGEYFEFPKEIRKTTNPHVFHYSLTNGCSACGYSWPDMDTRHFSPNSLGACKTCKGRGISDDESGKVCEDCSGTGITHEVSSIKLAGLPIQSVYNQSIEGLNLIMSKTLGCHDSNPAFKRVLEEINATLGRLEVIGLSYLHLSRRIHTLSGGELQRLKLAQILSETMSGVLYILDEPSQGLHPSETEQIWSALLRLKNNGNTIIIVDHDEFFLSNVDEIVDLGPGGGAQGGEIMAIFNPSQASTYQNVSQTAKGLCLSKQRTRSSIRNTVSPGKHGFIQLNQVRLNNLNIDSVRFRLGGVNVVTGVSGSGKSSLVLGALYQNLFNKLNSDKSSLENVVSMDGHSALEKVYLIDRKPVAKSEVSMPVSYLDIFTDIRKLYGELPDAQISGLTPRSFSTSTTGGRCEECLGRGKINLSMKFLPDARIGCPVCGGNRYQDHLLSIKYMDKNISEVLNFTIDQATIHFKSHKKIIRKLKPAQDLGLGYLTLGQSAASLSGGESQRIKICPFLAKTYSPKTMFIFDEPTRGLHMSDIDKLLTVFTRLVKIGATIILIEHNLDVVKYADWIVDLGPGPATNGGKVVYAGDPKGLKECPDSLTGKYL